MLSFVAVCIIYFDPYFHYHAPLSDFQYRLYDERYQNDGILRHFSFDSVIIGTSMTRNFKSSDWDNLMNADTVKTPFSGASYKEIGDTLKRTLTRRDDIRYIIRCLDYSMLNDEADSMRYDSYPTYLYDDLILNDVNYVYNKQVLFNDVLDGIIRYTDQGLEMVNFDRYRNDDSGSYGKEVVMGTYNRQERVPEQPEQHLSVDNIEKNVIDIIRNNPQIKFYLFFSPYSILYYDLLNQEGELKNHFLQEKEAIELLIPYENVYLFSFSDNFELITDLDNYMDYLHYNQEVCSYISQSMAEGNHWVTQDNYLEYCDKCLDFYETYDYERLFN